MSDLPEKNPEKKDPRKREKHPDRVYLSGLALETLSAWATQVQEALPGVRVTKSDLVNWRLQSEPKVLSEKSLLEIETRFFSPVKFARWAAQEVVNAHARGELKTLRDVLESRRKPRAKKSASKTKLPRENAPHNPPKNLEPSEES